MKLGILSKREIMFTGKMKNFFEKNMGYKVKIYTLKNLCINESLFENDFYILKSKSLFFIYAANYIKANGIPIFPDPDISYKLKNRIEAHYLLKKAGLKVPHFFLGTPDTLKNQLNTNDFPLILKTIMGSGSRGIRLIDSKMELNSGSDEILYLEKFINGEHYNVYFIGDDICTSIKPPLVNEHANMEHIQTPDDIKDIIHKWKRYFKGNILFGHLDIVREESSNDLYIVDPGSFPEFSNWKCPTDPVKRISNLIIEQIRLQT
jgi:glutathione synthase/RimK-type ligase-like ATP-grasp enzyme